MKVKAWRWLLGCVLCLLGAAGVGAQDDGAPLIWLQEGNLWSWQPGDAAPTSLAACGGPTLEPIQSALMLSPDGEHIAFETWPALTTETLARVGGFAGGKYPSDLWICNIREGRPWKIAQQPEDAALFDEGGRPDKADVRSSPYWSPDGGQLAYSEYQYVERGLNVTRYDLASGETRVIVPEVPPQYGVPGPLDIRWGGPNLLVRSITFDEDFISHEAIQVYDADGALVAEYEVEAPVANGFITDFDWVMDGDQRLIGVLFSGGVWLLIDPDSGESTVLTDGYLEQYSLASPDGASAVLVPGEGSDFTWYARQPGSDALTPLASARYTPSRIAIAPSGDAIAYEADQLYVWGADGVEAIAGTEVAQFSSGISVVWGPVGWRVWREVIPQGEAACPGFIESRLAAGERGRVLPVGSNNVRSEPSTGASRVGVIPVGGEFSVLAGPECADGYAWWQVDYDGMVGWTAEGEGETYWLEPLS